MVNAVPEVNIFPKVSLISHTVSDENPYLYVEVFGFASVTVILIASLSTPTAEILSVKEITGNIVSTVILDIGKYGEIKSVI
jgi:hypothetical protein